MFLYHFKKIFTDGREKVISEYNTVYWTVDGLFHRVNQDLPAYFYRTGAKTWYHYGRAVKEQMDGCPPKYYFG